MANWVGIINIAHISFMGIVPAITLVSVYFIFPIVLVLTLSTLAFLIHDVKDNGQPASTDEQRHALTQTLPSVIDGSPAPSTSLRQNDEGSLRNGDRGDTEEEMEDDRNTRKNNSTYTIS